jgi:aryl-alcohol dehydrogenase-like predicted oxidoreductase
MSEPAVTHRSLGRSGLRVTSQGLGLMSLSGIYGASSDENGIEVIHRALDLGIDFLDSADMYGWGHNEQLLGRALKNRRSGVIVASKFGQTQSATGVNGVNGRPEYVQQACEASLKRLGLEVIDLYYIHRIDPSVPIEDTVGAMSRLVEQGKVRYLGICEARPATIRRAHAVHAIAAIQTEYSLMYRQEAEETLATTRELGIGFVAYAPLGRSLLTGSVHSPSDVENDRRKDHPRFHAEHFQHNKNQVDQLVRIAAEKSCSPGQLALAWVLAQGDDLVAIPGTKQVSRVQENLAALQVKLTADDLKALDQVFPPGSAAGSRYPAGGMKAVYL